MSSQALHAGEFSASAELSSLIETLHQTSRRLEELTAGEVDSVADCDGRTLLLGRAQEALRADVASRQAAILDALPANIALLDASGRIVAVNRSWEHFATSNGMTGPTLAVGLNYLDVCDAATGVDAEEAQSVAGGIRSVIGNAAESFTIEYPCHSPTQQRWYRMTVTPLAAEKSIGAVVMHIDISPQRRSEKKISETQNQLIEASRMAGRADVATTVLHNVGNVLNSVNVSADLVMDSIRSARLSRLTDIVTMLRDTENKLARSVDDDPRRRHIVEFIDDLAQELVMQRNMIVAELELLRDNIDHIKEIVAMQQTHAMGATSPEPVSIQSLVDQTLRAQRGSLRDSGVHVVCELDEIPPITVIKHKVLQIMINLMRNATLACEESGRPDKCIWIRATHRGNYIRISVRDNGTGIAAENMIRIFSHGFTTRKDGHGFGLHSGALDAAELGGSLSASSEGPGKGATFTLDLPSAGPGPE